MTMDNLHAILFTEKIKRKTPFKKREDFFFFFKTNLKMLRHCATKEGHLKYFFSLKMKKRKKVFMQIVHYRKRQNK